MEGAVRKSKSKPTAAAIVGMADALGMPSNRRQKGWISAADKLPDSSRAVLTRDGSSKPVIGYRITDPSPGWVSVTGKLINVTHWRDL